MQQLQPSTAWLPCIQVIQFIGLITIERIFRENKLIICFRHCMHDKLMMLLCYVFQNDSYGAIFTKFLMK